MSAVPAPSVGAVQISSAPDRPDRSDRSFRSMLDARKSEGRRLSLDDAMAVLVPVCVDLKERHARGEKLYLHPSAITQSPDGLMRVNPSLAVAPTEARDRACLAPELVKATSPGDARASVFALGAMLYEAVTGSAVGPGMRRPRDVDPKLPESLEVLLGKALVADPAHRPDDIGALASAMHHLAPMKSLPPPDADVRGLDIVHGEPVDMRMSLLPPVEVQFSLGPPPASVPPMPAMPPSAQSAPTSASFATQAALNRDPTKQLAHLKARLESDIRPRYVVNKDRMDHGPFSAVELLQQIASHAFKGGDGLRDELTGVSQKIDEWEEFAPFAEHARMHRQIAQEKVEVAQVEKAEKKAGVAKVVIGAILAVAIVGVGVAFVVKKVGERKDGTEVAGDDSNVDLTNGGSAKGGKNGKGPNGRHGGGPANGKPGQGGSSGMSYEEALNQGSDLNMNGGGGVADLSNAELSGPMSHVNVVSCGAPGDMKVTIRVAVQNGHAKGVQVSTNPANPGVAGCVDRAVRGLQWRASPKLDSFTTQF